MDVNIIFAIVPRLLPILMLGLVALVGLLIQGKSFDEILRGTVKAMAGFLILFLAVDIIVASIDPLGVLFGKVYAIEGGGQVFDWIGYLGEYGVQIVIVMALGFLVNLIIVRFTKLKYVFLTGHILFWYAYTMVGALADGGVITGLPLILIGSVLLGIFVSVMPALIAPVVEKATGNKDFVIGHSTTFLAWIASTVGGAVGDPSKSAEDINFPKGLNWMKEMVISTSLIMLVLYLIFGWVAGVGFAAEQFVGGNVGLWYLWVILQGLQFGAGLVVLLAGVRMMLAEIVPAFRGIAQKIVPGAVPALDCPMIFPYGTTSLAIGFPIAMFAQLITLVIFGVAGFKFVLVPMVVAAFFDAGPGAVLANVTGGRRGVIFGSIAAGVVMVFLQAFGMFFVQNTAAGFVQVFGGNDVGLMAIVVGGIARLLGF